MKECDKRLAHYRAALAAGVDPAVVTRWINDTQTDKRTALTRLEEVETRTTTGPKKAEKTGKPLTEKKIVAIMRNLGNVA